VPRILFAAAAMVSAGIAFGPAAVAQDSDAAPPAAEAGQQGGERINQVIVYGNDPCPASAGDEITVCARKSESERYRIPEILRGNNTTPENSAWNNKVLAYETVSKTGTMSCSPVGPGGSTGCLQKLINASYAEKQTDPSVHFSELIEQEREKRLSTIDAQAAATQQRVEEAEQQYEESQRKQATPPPAPAAPAAPPAPLSGNAP
jgi:hypothetical protein